MWGYEAWIEGFSPGGIAFFLIWGLIMLVLVFLVVKISKMIRYGKDDPRLDRADSLKFLKDRFVNGNISEKEYLKMKKILCE